MTPVARQPEKRRYQLVVSLVAAIFGVLLVLTGVELRREFASAGALRAAVERSYNTRLQIQSVFSLMQDAETGQRGYIITGNPRFLEPYDHALDRLDSQMTALGNLYLGNAEQTGNARNLSRQIARKREIMQRTISLRQVGDAAAASALVSSGEGKAAMDEIRRLVDLMTQQEANHLAQLSDKARFRTARTEILVVALFLALVLTAAGTAFLVWRYLATRGVLLERLQAAAARHAATLDSAFDAIITLNPSGSIETLNPAAERMFGWRAEELIRRDVSLLIDLANNGEGSFLDRLGASQGALAAGLLRELNGKRRDGETFAADVALGAMDLPTGRHVVAVVRDITERRRVAEMKDAFVSTVSHELRTPLTSIAGSLGLLVAGAGGELPDKAARLIGIAHSNSQRLVRLINDILDVEKLASGKLVMAMSSLDLREIAARSIEGVRGYADQLGVILTLAQGDAAPVRGDADRLIQVVTNLLSNAAKFSPAGGEVAVTVNPEARIARLSVIDHGPGIPDAFRARIFSKFAQADSTDTRAKGGTGLGLAIAREIAELHGGRLWFESAEGDGATFHLDLPLDLPDLAVGRGVGRILICEDDPDAARVLAEMVAQEGYDADVAATAREALTMARAGRYALGLVDLHLPDADGVSLIRALKADEDTRAMPVIVVSGDVARGRVRGRSLEVADWMEKPVDLSRLRLAVQALARADTKPFVLHVDDDRDILEVTRQALSSVELRGVESLAEARDALRDRRPDLVILDLGLPDGHGLDLLPELTDEDGRTIPVVIYSAQDADHQAAPAVQAVLTKSRMSLTQLARTVRRMTRSSRGRP
ncbi:PAS domain S-box-containing protein [Brevundimonas sp. 1080]|uniref:CHASE3 domain-containing protein n=1 Tax=Brevundimonas sp. 1080 TaxID=3156405 RepID=UPI00339A7294